MVRGRHRLHRRVHGSARCEHRDARTAALGRDLHASVGAVEWVALAYLLVLVATVATVGRIADAVGRKLLYVYGFAVFTAGSVLCGLAPTLAVLIAAGCCRR